MASPVRTFLTAALAAAAVCVLAAPPKPAPVGALSMPGSEKALTLDGPYASIRLLVDARTPDGVVRDVSHEAAYTLSDPKLGVVDDGTLRPKKDGTAQLTARWKGLSLTVPVVVTGIAKPHAPRFATEVVPILTRYGCNQGSCHGAAQGKGGFKLSLQGYDPESDYDAITRAAAARRVSPAQPANSLLLRKPTAAVMHKGGKLFDVGSPAHRLLEDWITAGMPAPDPKEPGVAGLDIVPAGRSLKVGQKQTIRVIARFTDGTKRDVSAETLFGASDGAVASVSTTGQASIVGKGEAAVLIRYRDLVATASLLAPFSTPRRILSPAPTDPTGRIDRAVDEKLAALGLDASPKCSDSDFVRRVYLDVIGLPPTADEVRAFHADTAPDKREKLIDALLERPEYVDFWTLKWGDLFRSTRNALNDRGLQSLNRWIRRSVASNKSWDRMARELILARGSMYDEGAANYFRASEGPQNLTETTSQVFLGVRMQCAKCHNHPYEKWRLNQYYELAAFFARVRTKAGDNPDERIVYTVSGGEVTHPKTGAVMTPAALDAAPLPKDYNGDRREALANWLTGPKNPFFARILVNRLWKHFLGQGLVEPVDDMRVTNPATNEKLLDTLARDFVTQHYDVKGLMRSILRSRVYQRSALPTASNAADTHYFSHYFFKRLGAEQLLDAVGMATGVPEKFGGYPAGLRAAQLPDTTAQSYFLDLFGRPARNIVCQCERLDAPNLGQVLHFLNSKDINDRLASKTGRVAQLLAAKTPYPKMVEELYLSALSRPPDDDEMLEAVMELTLATDKQKAGEDILWALLNTKEFLFNH